MASLALKKYLGQAVVYILFTLIANALLYLGFRRDAIFFDTFIGLFFWLGFWLKLTLRLIFTNGHLADSTGHFNGSGAAFDHALLVATCGLSGLLVVSLLRRYIFFNYPDKMQKISRQGLFFFYINNRRNIILFFISFFTIIAISNMALGVYQRGIITQKILPFGFNGIYKWLLLFGFASFSALILRFESEISKNTSLLAIYVSILESFISSISLLSRGMILNTSALLYGNFINSKLHAIKTNIRFWIAALSIFGSFFICSVFFVNYIRIHNYMPTNSINSINSTSSNISNLAILDMLPLISDRWVGMEGVMAVSSYPNLGWNLWQSALSETYNENETSFYDLNIIETPYKKTDKTKFHFISLPGIIAFFFYPGSFLFLFASMFALGGFAAIIENLVYRLGGGNVILCALMAQVIAYRFASFGYVPAQSYLLIGALFLNLLLIYFADKFLCFIKPVVKS